MPNQTHELTFTASEVRKRYVSWDRGEADREWGCLILLDAHAPGVAPWPLRRETHGGAPVVVMQRLHGTPLGDAPLTPDQTASLGRALRQTYDVPLDAVRQAGITERVYGPSTLPCEVAGWLRDPRDLSQCQDPGLVQTAVEAALDWLAAGAGLPAPRKRRRTAC